MAKVKEDTKPADETINADTSASVDSTALATQQQGGAVALFEGYEEDAGAGLENVSREEYKIPMLRIVQGLSKAARPEEAGGLGLSAGHIINTATSDYWNGKEGIEIIAVERDHNYVEMIPMTDGKPGGFVGILPADDPEVGALLAKQGKFKKLKRTFGDQDTEISDTYYLYVIACPKDGAPFRALVPFSSSSIPVYQTFMNRVMGIQYAVEKNGKKVLIKPALFAHRWLLQTVFEQKKDKGYFNWKITLAVKGPDGKYKSIDSLLPVSDPLYQEAKEFNRLIKEGKTVADYSSASEDTDGDNVQPPPEQPSSLNVDDEIPFAS